VKTCAMEDCGRPLLARGLCGTHYARWRKHGTAEKSPPAPIPEGIKEIPGYPGYYCDRFGGVYTTRLKGRHLESRGPLREMRPRKREDGYLQAHFRMDGKEFLPLVHVLVLETWVGPRPGQKIVANHKNGVKNDNRVENLEWCTYSENTRHAIDVLGRDFRRKPKLH
jgi:hypothetical protein